MLLPRVGTEFHAWLIQVACLIQMTTKIGFTVLVTCIRV